MRKKNLLSESAVRRFMKLANLDTVGSRTLSEMREEEEMEEGMRGMMPGMRDEDPGMRDEDPGMRDEMREADEDSDLGDMDLGDMDLGGDDVAPDAEKVDDDIVPDAGGAEELELDVSPEKARAAKDAAELLMQIADAAMGADDMDMDMDMDAGGMGMDMDAGDMDMDPGGDDDEPDPLDEVEIIDEKALVSEVTRRVSERLRKMLKSSKR